MGNGRCMIHPGQGGARSPDSAPSSPGDHCQVLVRDRWGRVLPEQRPCPQDESVGQVSEAVGVPAAQVGCRELKRR